MTTFLELIAKDLYKELGGDFSKTTIIFPNKRANLFFNNYLAQISSAPIFAPKYASISEVFSSLSNRNICDPIQLVCKLYNAFKEVTNTEETLDKFYSWGEMMLSDFEDVDNNMADASKLFINLSELEEMTDFSFLTDEQEQVIRTVFDNFDKNSRTRLKDKFMNIWDALYPTYINLNTSLKKDNLCYEGMMKREIIETLEKEPESLIDKLKSENYVIVGFNVLNETERRFFKFLKKNKNTFFYWDFDEAYLNNEAGQFIKQDIEEFGNRFADHAEYYRNFKKKKDISFIESSTENAQTRYVCKWIADNVKDASRLNENAVVLCNESDLPSVLHSIPAKLSDEKETELAKDDDHTLLNVTMGFPLADTLAFSFVQAQLELQIHGKTSEGNWRYIPVANVLRHPFVRRISGNASIGVLNSLKDSNVIFPSEKAIMNSLKESMGEGDDVQVLSNIQKIFTPQKSKLDITSYIADLLKIIGVSYKADKDEILQKESIFFAYTVINRVHSLIEQEPTLASANEDTLFRLIRQIMSSKSIPFHGEPAIGLQVMGILETRNLDFKNVILLSCNEGMLPKSTNKASLIPYALRDAYGMTTMEKQTSLYAYYFYNLLQRAENITIIYNSSSDGLNRGEKSRFMMQLEIEANKIFGPDNKIVKKILLADNEPQKTNDVFATKTSELMDFMYNKFKNKPLSPTAINNYLRCPLKFYFMHIAEYREQNEVTEEVDKSTFGTIFHKCMEDIYRSFGDRQIQANDLKAIADDKNKISRIVDEAFATEFFHKKTSDAIKYNGEQILNHKVLCKYVKNQLLFDMKSCPMRDVHVETRIFHNIDINGHSICLGGYIDRYETIVDPVTNEDRIRIVDYKTGANEKNATMDNLFSKEGNAKNHCQAMYYCYVFQKNMENGTINGGKILPIQPALMYVIQPLDSRTDNFVINKNAVNDFAQYETEYFAKLKQTIEEIFDDSKSFKQCEDNSKCEYCPFTQFCRR